MWRMPKLKKVKKTSNSMTWEGEDISTTVNSRCVLTSIPKRELNKFLDKGMKIKSIKVTFEYK